MESVEQKATFIEKIAEKAISWIGSVQSLIAHTFLFILSFSLPILHIIDFDKMLLVLTTIVSLEAIYLSIFIQMSVNKSSQHIENIKEDVIEIQGDIDEIQEDIEEINEDIDEIQEDIEEINDEEDDDDDDDPAEKAKKVMLKSNVSLNTNKIKELKTKIEELQNQIEVLKKEE